MKKKILIIVGVLLIFLVVIVLAGGPLLNALGVEVLCISNENGRTRLVRCGDETALPAYLQELAADTDPPKLVVGARPFLIDTDMAIDDWMAILYLLQLPEVDVQAITVTGAGEAHCHPGVQNALDLAALAGRTDIPVTCGRETPLKGNRVFPQSWRDNVDSLAGVSVPTSDSKPVNQDAGNLIANTIRAAGGELEIIALGPLTNLAEVFLADPSLAKEVTQVYIMGGAFDVPGNVADSPEMSINNETAEWNIYVDPYSAAQVVVSGAPVTFVPLDASNHVLLDEIFYNRLGEDRNTPEAEFVYQALTQSIGFVRSGNYYFWDPLTAAIAVDESLGTFDMQPVIVIEEEGPESGATRVDETGNSVRIIRTAEGERFKQHFLDVLNGRITE
jgi:pyrimidine-specific ribonucleoside hydrolase